MQVEHWGAMPEDDEDPEDQSDKLVPIYAKKLMLEEIRQRGELEPEENEHIVELNSSLVTQTIEVMKQTEVLQSLIETYSNKNGSSNYLLNPCQMIPEVDFPPENAADLVGEQKFQKPIWFIPTADTAYSRGDPQHYPQISISACRQALRKVMCGMLRLAGFTDCSESAIQLLTDASEEFLRSFICEYRACYDVDPKTRKSTVLQLLPLERAHTALTGTSLTQVHNYYKHKVITRNRVEIGEFNSVLQDYDQLMKESQSSMQRQQEFNSSDFLNILDNSTTGSNQSMGNIVGDMMQDLGGGSSSGGLSTMTIGNVSQQQMLYGLLDCQGSTSSSNVPSSSSMGTGNASNGNGSTGNGSSSSAGFQTNFDS
ncbi:uncharacterized protein LOC117903863 [Drosophila subobscura]|uniref:uncharacterized protein LOC117903863 n=1 Tax=Drosophila subobscura TaxID=7241 RepID=UPI00155A9850|nr:uncharacterized protein LOC117903863 [Drosophila subobscura]